MKKIQCTLLGLVLFSGITYAQSFEGENTLTNIKADKASTLSISPKYFKDGQKSLLWQWTKPKATLTFTDEDISKSVEKFKNRGGVKIWIYNENPNKDHLTFNFKNQKGVTEYTFNFNLNFTGWRAAWIAYSDMWTTSGGKTEKKDITSMEVVSPESSPKGDLWIDRVEFGYVDRQATPDAQLPDSNRHLTREIWHWGLLHKWNKNEYDIPAPRYVNDLEQQFLNRVIFRVKELYSEAPLRDKDIDKLKKLEETFNISDDGTKGAPLMQKDNLRKGDVNYRQLNDLLFLASRGWVNTGDTYYKNLFIKGIRYMLNQGFAYESAMGTNHHYGYEIRELFGAVWSMKDILKQEKLWDETIKTLDFWSGLPETRVPHDRLRDELTDSWNTLLISRLTVALMADTPEEQYRNLKALSRWVSGTLDFTPGTIGGIKADGTVFHHGGHYPAYGVPGLTAIGQYLKCVNGTPFNISEQAKENYKFALHSLYTQINTVDWGMAVSGRHPLSAKYNYVGRKGITAFAYAALAFKPVDKELASEYLRLIEGSKQYTEEKDLVSKFEKLGIKKAESPQGFYVYNYASQGIYRYNDIMVSIKGFNRNIWGSEMYSKDNRFGRYQSYGSIQIIGTVDTEKGIITEEASRYKEDGWDWSHNPGTTAIELPLDKLESPLKGSDMLRQPNDFSGASNLENGKYGMFTMKLGEDDKPNFTPSFNAYKSVFCFGNKVINIGSDISNENKEYPTLTTLFQQYLVAQDEPIVFNDKSITEFPYKEETTTTGTTILKDITGYHYYIPNNQNLTIEKIAQKSIDNRKQKSTEGDFATAYLSQGVAPKNATYEYMILLDASKDQLNQLSRGNTGYRIIKQDNVAHIVEDTDTKVRGYSIFNDYTSTTDDYILKADKETIIMLQPKGNTISISVCSPDLNIKEYTYTTSKESEPITKKIVIKGKYKIAENNSKISVNYDGNNTIFSVICKDGMPEEFSIIKG
ncbi:hypothetical protein KRX57_09520 [Weeksellaceae bacterium TAE3-ERU29]|nr:hypothetical protein [Weeksellaceae bacterium TAE3-ERU29]